MSFLKKNGKLILGALFILLALTPILFSPLVEIIFALINGMELSVKSILNLWTNKSIFSWLIVAVYLGIGINLILQRLEHDNRRGCVGCKGYRLNVAKSEKGVFIIVYLFCGIGASEIEHHIDLVEGDTLCLGRVNAQRCCKMP